MIRHIACFLRLKLVGQKYGQLIFNASLFLVNLTEAYGKYGWRAVPPDQDVVWQARERSVRRIALQDANQLLIDRWLP